MNGDKTAFRKKTSLLCFPFSPPERNVSLRSRDSRSVILFHQVSEKRPQKKEANHSVCTKKQTTEVCFSPALGSTRLSSRLVGVVFMSEPGVEEMENGGKVPETSGCRR